MLRPGFVLALVAALAAAGLTIAFTAASRVRAQAVGPAASAAQVRRLRPIDRVQPSTGSDPVKTSARLSTGSDPVESSVQRSTGSAGSGSTGSGSTGSDPVEVLRVRDGARVALRDRPGGRAIARLGDRTEFGSPTTLSVVERRGFWAGVPSSALGNGRLGWVDTRDAALARRATDARLTVSLGRRRLELRVRGRLVRRVAVAIGRPGSTTPTGSFAVTDKIAGTQFGPYYGCCILALSGHQPHTPPGWTGGDRLAIHGTNDPASVGTPSSAGCLRAAEADLRVLMRRVPLGTPVVIRG